MFRWAWERLSQSLSERTADREYLQVLHHAALTMQCEVEAVLSRMHRTGELPRLDRVLEECRPAVPEPPRLKPLVVNLHDYDELLLCQGVPA